MDERVKEDIDECMNSIQADAILYGIYSTIYTGVSWFMVDILNIYTQFHCCIWMTITRNIRKTGNDVWYVILLTQGVVNVNRHGVQLLYIFPGVSLSTSV